MCRVPNWQNKMSVSRRCCPAYSLFQEARYASILLPQNAHACVAQIFGKVMVCKDLPTAHKVANRAHHLNFVTIKGEQVSKKGTITGGYIDQSRWVGSAQP